MLDFVPQVRESYLRLSDINHLYKILYYIILYYIILYYIYYIILYYIIHQFYDST